MKNKLRDMARVFPNSKIKENGQRLEFFFEPGDDGDNLIIKTPDRSEPYKQALASLKECGLTGVWRSREEQ